MCSLAAKASSGIIPEMVGCLLCLFVGEASNRQSVVAVPVEASDGSIPKMAGCLLCLLVGEVSKR